MSVRKLFVCHVPSLTSTFEMPLDKFVGDKCIYPKGYVPISKLRIQVSSSTMMEGEMETTDYTEISKGALLETLERSLARMLPNQSVSIIIDHRKERKSPHEEWRADLVDENQHTVLTVTVAIELEN